jgi:hypothetical protein
MLLTSAQVSIAISSTIGNIKLNTFYIYLNIYANLHLHTVFIFTTTLFLCGYVLQQQTVNSLREAIKPRPRPTHISFYLPPQFQPTSTLEAGDNDAVQVEITVGTNDGDRHPRNGDAAEHAMEEQGTDQQFLQSGSRSTQDTEIGKQEHLKQSDQDAPDLSPELSTELPSEGISNLRISREGGKAPPSVKRLSMAARRRAIKEEIRRLSGQDLLDNPKAYRRRLW